jgi:transcriptional regulator with XRE-family HTH domain
MMHIGKQIKKILKDKGMGVSELARRISTNRNNVYDIFLRENIDTALLKKISVALQHDFFRYFIHDKNVLPDIMTGSDKPIMTGESDTHYITSKEFITLQHKIEQLQKENQLLKKWLKDKEVIIKMLQSKKK